MTTTTDLNTRQSGSDLGSWIREKRMQQKVSQRELADKAGLSRSYVCDIERSRGTRPSIDTLNRLAGALGADRTELLRVAGILEPLRDPIEYSSERRLVSVFRGLNEAHQAAVERFARFLLAEEQHWVQVRFDGVDSERNIDHSASRSGPTLFELDEH
jgi:transcriptional regulator with XRE-family HTH domain